MVPGYNRNDEGKKTEILKSIDESEILYENIQVNKKNLNKTKSNNIESNICIYYWGDYCHNKVIRPKCHYHLGAAPFFYGHLLNFRESIERKGTIFYLPRTDNQITFDCNSKVFEQQVLGSRHRSTSRHPVPPGTHRSGRPLDLGRGQWQTTGCCGHG